MPRKPKLEKKTVTVIVDGTPVAVVLHPPQGCRTSWYAYWTGLVTSKTTGQRDFAEAVKAVEGMLRNGGRRPQVKDAMLADGEFEEIQRIHFGKKTDTTSKARADKTLRAFLQAADAFREITGVQPITLATADDCAAFQRKALTLPKNWRQQHPKGKKPEEAERISPNTVLKWSRALQAAFERANRNAGRKCVRGVVDEKRLLSVNVWNQFDWIEGTEKPIRQFDPDELLNFLTYLETAWAGVTVASALTKVYLWSACRQEEVTSLSWDNLQIVGGEYHFEIVGKWNVRRWFRVPEKLYQELASIRTDSPFVFAAYNEQLRRFHERSDRPHNAHKVSAEFKPVCLGDWLYDRLAEWSATSPKGHAHPHIFRKTALQHAWIGEDEATQRVAEDARVGKEVLTAHYLKVDLWRKSNRTFRRILAALPDEVSRRFGHVEDQRPLEQQLGDAVAAKDWKAVTNLSTQLAGHSVPPAV
jgi:integrase